MAELAKQTNGCLSPAITAQSRVAHSVFVSRLHCFSWSQHWIINIYILIRSSDVDININFFLWGGGHWRFSLWRACICGAELLGLDWRPQRRKRCTAASLVSHDSLSPEIRADGGELKSVQSMVCSQLVADNKEWSLNLDAIAPLLCIRDPKPFKPFLIRLIGFHVSV